MCSDRKITVTSFHTNEGLYIGRDNRINVARVIIRLFLKRQQ